MRQRRIRGEYLGSVAVNHEHIEDVVSVVALESLLPKGAINAASIPNGHADGD